MSVTRQAQESDILLNATALRELMEQYNPPDYQFDLTGTGDMVRLVEGYDIQDAIDDAYSQYGRSETAMILRSNKRANAYNKNVRERILFLESMISVGDLVMVVRNNYFWLKPNDQAGFIANGDTLEILEMFAIKELYGFTFAEVKVQMVDYPDQLPFETVLILDVLDAPTPSMTFEDHNRLYEEVRQDYAGETSKYKQYQLVKSNKYYNALQEICLCYYLSQVARRAVGCCFCRKAIFA